MLLVLKGAKRHRIIIFAFDWEQKKKQRNEKPTITNNKTNQWISKKWWHRNYMSISLYGGMHGKCSASLWFINVCTFWHHFVVVVVRCQPVFPSKCYLLWIRSFESLAQNLWRKKKSASGIYNMKQTAYKNVKYH